VKSGTAPTIKLLRKLKGGRYELDGPPIGGGGMAIVFRGLDTHLRCPVAVKVITPEFAARSAITPGRESVRR
jgi:hypothetical protein